ncbi:MAG: DUF4382 domain-containing protein [Reichenbachiella sp.]
MKKGIILSVIGLIGVVFLNSCGEDEKNTATIQVSLVDAPGDYESVFIDLVDVQVNTGEDSWESLESAQMGVYDLIQLTNGTEAFLGEIELPEGQMGQVRLILGENNELVVDGVTKDLTVPSGSQSGLKLNVDGDIVGGVTYKLIIDFDAAKSVVEAGNSGKYNLKPVIRAEFEAQTGAIEGVLSPADVESVVYAIMGTDSVSSYPDETGGFMLRALDAGTYDVVAISSSQDLMDTLTVEDVTVVVGEVVELDSLFFE